MSVQLTYAAVGEAFKELLYDEILAMAVQIQGEIGRNTPRATSSLAGSWQVEGSMAVNGIEMSVGSPKWDLYGSYPEFGTKPHWAPIEPLITWVREKGLAHLTVDIRPVKGQMKRTRGQSKADYREAKIKRIARAIQVKIAREGTAAQFYVLRSIQSLGINYRVVTTGDGIYYHLDPTGYLEQSGFMQKLQSRLA